ncbi:DUF642 domain-containing protein [Paucibacter sp. JuS9]|uniref:DUF642 domain-containing protein n=1 Tax=Paucibacter sp. JuS9 TaxID=3228748 RepID=UPI003756A703
MKKLLAAALLTAPLLALASPVNLLSNGSFEATPQAAGTWSRQSTLPGWVVAANQAELRNDVAGKASQGVNYLELDVDNNSLISQTISTLLGQWYELSFDYSNRSGVAVSSNGLGWSFGGASGLAPVLAYNGSSGNQWSHFSILVQATGTSSTLSLWATGTSDSLGSSLDNVSLNTPGGSSASTAVPEPQSLALMLAGLAGMLFVSRRRRA